MKYLRTHIRIVTAFVMREISTRYGKSPGGYIWAFVEPIAFIAIMTTLVSFIGRHPPIGTSYVLFYATGYLAFSMFRGMESYLSSSISANRPLMSYPIVAPIDAVIGRFILQGMTSLLVTLIVLFASLHTERNPGHVNWLPVIQAILFAWGLAFGVAMTNIVLFFHFPVYQKVYQICTRPLLLISGVFHVPSLMPQPMRDVLLSNPVAQVITLFRTGFYGSSGSDGLDIGFLAICTAVALGVGMVTFTLIDVARVREK